MAMDFEAWILTRRAQLQVLVDKCNQGEPRIGYYAKLELLDEVESLLAFATCADRLQSEVGKQTPNDEQK